jgi:hypothetical protein
MARQTLPRLIGRELCTLQAMSLPTGKMFFLDLLRDDGSDIADYGQWDENADYAKFDDSTRTANPLGEGLDISTGMKLTISSRDISITQSKKLLTEVSWELATDLRAYHNLDAAEILSGAAADEIAREWDAKIVQKAYAAASVAGRTVTFGKAPAGYPVDKWASRVQRAILQADNMVYVDKGRSTNYMICGVNAALELMDLNTFTADAGFVGANETASFGLQRIGTLSQTHKVFRSRYVAPNEIILGRNGDSVLDSGLFLLSYVPLFITDRVLNPRNQKYEQSFASRMDLVLGGRDDADGKKLFARVKFDDTATGITVS